MLNAFVLMDGPVFAGVEFALGTALAHQLHKCLGMITTMTNAAT